MKKDVKKQRLEDIKNSTLITESNADEIEKIMRDKMKADNLKRITEHCTKTTVIVELKDLREFEICDNVIIVRDDKKIVKKFTFLTKDEAFDQYQFLENAIHRGDARTTICWF